MYSLVRSDGLPQNRKISQEERRKRNRCTVVHFDDEIKVPRFQENECVERPDEYKKIGTDPSLLVIFNQRSFKDDNRLGTNKDVNELILTFGRLGHNVEKEFIFSDLSKEKMLSVVDELSRRDFSNRNSLIVIVLTHGKCNNVISASDGDISTHEIWEPFYKSTCPSFKDKPKFFIFQACKGKGFSKVNEIDGDIFPECTFSTPLDSDMLIAYATAEGSVANRHIFNGTWFIQELCKNLNAYGRRDDVLTLLIRTNKCIANNYYHVNDDDELIKQMPLFISTLTKKFFLATSKERRNLFQMIEQQQKIIEDVEELRSLVRDKKKNQ